MPENINPPLADAARQHARSMGYRLGVRHYSGPSMPLRNGLRRCIADRLSTPANRTSIVHGDPGILYALERKAFATGGRGALRWVSHKVRRQLSPRKAILPLLISSVAVHPR